jgi:hypothetical protein
MLLCLRGAQLSENLRGLVFANLFPSEISSKKSFWEMKPIENRILMHCVLFSMISLSLVALEYCHIIIY